MEDTSVLTCKNVITMRWGSARTVCPACTSLGFHRQWQTQLFKDAYLHNNVYCGTAHNNWVIGGKGNVVDRHNGWCFSAIKKNKVMPFVGEKWMQLEIITLSKLSQSQKDKYPVLSHLWFLHVLQSYEIHVHLYWMEAEVMLSREWGDKL